MKELKIKDFLGFKTKESVYVMGFLWADGHLKKDGRRITVNFNIKDFKDLCRILKKQDTGILTFAAIRQR